jgi:predicted porin
MHKKIAVLAIAAAFNAPAYADNLNVNWYGKVFLNAESVNNDKVVATRDRASRVLSNGSRLGVKGSEDLADGLKGIYQLEVQVDGDGTGKNGFASGTRNSGVGLEGGFGKLIVGVWDTPFKTAHSKIELFDNASSFTALNLIGRAGGPGITSPITVAGNNYNTREDSVIEYWTPKFGSFQGAISYSPDPKPTLTASKDNLSLSGTFEQDGIYASLAYERRPDVFAGTTDTGLRAVGRYDIGDAWLGAAYERIRINRSATASYTQGNIEVAGQYKFGSNKIALSYAKAGETDVTKDGATQLALRYGYEFSKRTEVFAAYASLRNDTAASYVLGNPYGAAGEQTGSTQTALGAGIVHNF